MGTQWGNMRHGLVGTQPAPGRRPSHPWEEEAHRIWSPAPWLSGRAMLGVWWSQWLDPALAWEVGYAALLKAMEGGKERDPEGPQVSSLAQSPLPARWRGHSPHAPFPSQTRSSRSSPCTQPTLPNQAMAGSPRLCSFSFPGPRSHNYPQVLRITKKMSRVHGHSDFKGLQSEPTLWGGLHYMGHL